ncbi:MAG: ABC transporter ATP-binding protein [Bacillota bacterium]|nr:ABC transporter ATP-binding protein [Bacillota bacterium]
MKTFSFMKPEWKALLLIALLLVAQVFAELALPAYTSSLVNIGVQQGGITSSLTGKITRQSMQDLALLMTEEEKQAVFAAYSEQGDIYVLNKDLSTKQKEKATKALNLPMAMLFGLNAAPQGQAALLMLRSGVMSRDKLLQTLHEVAPQMSLMEGQFEEQAAAQFILAENKRLGEDADQIRNAYLWRQGFLMLGLTLLSGLAATAVSFIASRTAARTGRRLRVQVYEKVLSFSKAEIDRFSTASLITRSGNDISQVQQTSVMMLRMMLYAPIMAIGGILQVIRASTGMGWIVALAVSLMTALVVGISIVVTPKFKLNQKLADKMNLVARENLTGVQVVRAFTREEHEARRYGEANDALSRIMTSITRNFAFFMPMMMLIINIITLLIMWFGAQGIDLGRMQVGDLMAFISYTMQITFAFMMVAMSLAVMMPRAEVSAQRIREVLDTDSIVKEDEAPLKLPPEARGSFRFKNVSFRYPDSKEDVLHNLDFEIKPGQTAAIIGATGSGKSSLLYLIPRFFDVSAGQILLDGVDISRLTLSDLRSQIGFVPQQAMLFSGTIESNIKFSDKDMANESMEKAAALAQASRFISEKENGFQSEVAQGGTNLSGGQKQRISIARAIAMKPKLLLFDDSFSALDYRTDLLVRQAIKEQLKDTTVLIVAQRIATVMQADTILVLEEGRLVGQGTHRELMETCEAYRQIARSQLSEEELLGKEGA